MAFCGVYVWAVVAVSFFFFFRGGGVPRARDYAGTSVVSSPVSYFDL